MPRFLRFVRGLALSGLASSCTAGATPTMDAGEEPIRDSSADSILTTDGGTPCRYMDGSVCPPNWYCTSVDSISSARCQESVDASADCFQRCGDIWCQQGTCAFLSLSCVTEGDTTYCKETRPVTGPLPPPDLPLWS